MKKHFNKETLTTKGDEEDFKNSTKCWICDIGYFDGDVKVRDRRGSALKDCNTNLKLNHKIPVVFHKLKKYFTQELDKFSLKLDVILNGWEKYMSFSINNKLSFIDSFPFLNSSSDSLVKHLGKDDFKNLSQEFDNNVLDLVKQKGFFPYEYMNNLKNF